MVLLVLLRYSQNPQAKLLDAAIYLASLASDPHRVNNILDPIRAMTAQAGFQKESLDAKQRAHLVTACDQLAAYLTTQEPIRAFTLEDLERRLQDRLEGAAAHRVLGRKLGITLAAMAVLGLSCLLVRPPAHALANTTSLISFYILLTLPTMFTAVSLGAAWIFISALRYFQPHLRRAYHLIALGVALLGLMHLQLAIVAYVSTMRSGWVWDGGVGLLYTPAHVLILVGTAMFARRLQIRSRWTAWPVVLTLIVIGAAIVVTAPHPPAKWGETFFDIATGTFPIGIVTSAAAAINCFMIARRVNEIYRQPMRWLAVSNALLSLTVLQILVVRLTFGYGNFWTEYGLIILPYFIASLLFLRASYLFNKVSNY